MVRGWPFIIAWCHRIAGLLLVGYLWFHIYTLLSLSSPSSYDATMKFYGFFLFRILEWALAIPVIFHAFNGGRLILMAHEANTVAMRMQNYFIKAVDISLVLVVLYHAGYGLVSLTGDYLESRTLRMGGWQVWFSWSCCCLQRLE